MTGSRCHFQHRNARACVRVQDVTSQIECAFGHQRGWSVMTTVHFRSLSIAAAAVLTLAGSGAAQESSSGPALFAGPPKTASSTR